MGWRLLRSGEAFCCWAEPVPLVRARPADPQLDCAQL